MPSSRPIRSARPIGLARIVGLPGALLVSAIAGALVLSGTAAASWGPPPLSWSNGVALCEFPLGSPFVSVSGASWNASGLTFGLSSVAEIAPNGSVNASMDLVGTTWQWTNASTASDYAIVLSARAPEASIVSGGMGNPLLTVSYSLPVATGDRNAVSVEVGVANWTWVSAGDRLEFGFAARPVSPSLDRLAASTTPGWLLSVRSNDSGVPLERVAVGSRAVAAGPEGTQNVTATPRLSLLSPSSAEISVMIGPTAGGFPTITYGAVIGVVTIAGTAIPWLDVAAVIGAATAITLVVAVTTRRIRQRPSPLIYSDTEL